MRNETLDPDDSSMFSQDDPQQQALLGADDELKSDCLHKSLDDYL